MELVISRDKLNAGDHIYSWRTAKIYSHHGIYIGDEKVIHFTAGGGQKIGTRTFLDKISSRSVSNDGGGGDEPCPKCGDQSNLEGVISSCLDCFLAGETCISSSTVSLQLSFSPNLDEEHAQQHLQIPVTKSFPARNSSYCVMGLVLTMLWITIVKILQYTVKLAYWSEKNNLFGRGGQAHLLSVVGFISRVLMPFASRAFRLTADIGVREEAMKVSVETLVARS